MTTLADLLDEPFARRHIGPDDAEVGDDARRRRVRHRSTTWPRPRCPPAIAAIDGSLDAARRRRPSPRSSPSCARSPPATGSGTAMIGLGYHGTHTPPVVLRNVLENPAWYTAYTPYQPEISQGRLQVLLRFQTIVEDLTGLAVAGRVDARRVARRRPRRWRWLAARRRCPTTPPFVVDADCLPQTIDVVRTRAEPLGLPVVVADLAEAVEALPDGDIFGVLVQYPGAVGPVVGSVRRARRRPASAAAIAVVAADLLALCLLRSPAELGADVACGTTQRFGVPLGYGGPHAGYLAVRSGLERSLPGRLVGVSVDADGAPATRLALQTREQHIRREKATSNICTAQVLLAVMAALYAQWHGPDGLVRIARRTHRLAALLADALAAGGVEVVHDTFFDTVTVRVPGRAAEVVVAADAAGVLLRLVDADHVGDRLRRDDHPGRSRRRCWRPSDARPPADGADAADRLPAALTRTSSFLEHPAFAAFHSETAMLRELRRLADHDLALDRTMIPLGSCTMKLNGTTEMEPITWPEFGATSIRSRRRPGPRATTPSSVTSSAGCVRSPATTPSPCSRTPAARASSPACSPSAPGTAAAATSTATCASSPPRRTARTPPRRRWRACGSSSSPARQPATSTSTTSTPRSPRPTARSPPSWSPTRRPTACSRRASSELCARVHDAGGQVYVDGANLNALVGLARPGRFGADVSHLNLHKTFCIPHGGGGPGVGPVAVRAHLAPFLPNHPLVAEAGPTDGVGPISGAPWGSAGILPIPWAYIRLMGPDGLRRATPGGDPRRQLRRPPPRASTTRCSTPGDGGLVAHECILDLRPLTKATGVTVDDVAKRLIDYGFHAPTMSFPVAGTLMVEPTESESLAELDRFCDGDDRHPRRDRRVPRGAAQRARTRRPWSAPTSGRIPTRGSGPRTRSSRSAQAKYWPPVRRIDGGYGDRNLVCACQ